jgi:hypothetical protein
MDQLRSWLHNLKQSHVTPNMPMLSRPIITTQQQSILTLQKLYIPHRASHHPNIQWNLLSPAAWCRGHRIPKTTSLITTTPGPHMLNLHAYTLHNPSYKSPIHCAICFKPNRRALKIHTKKHNPTTSDHGMGTCPLCTRYLTFATKPPDPIPICTMCQYQLTLLTATETLLTHCIPLPIKRITPRNPPPTHTSQYSMKKPLPFQTSIRNTQLGRSQSIFKTT